MIEFYSAEQFSSFISHASSHAIQQLSRQLSLPQLTLAAQWLLSLNLSNREEKALALFKGLKDNVQFEAVGKGSSDALFLFILRAMSEEELLPDYLSPLLVGLSPHIFFEALLRMPDAYLQPLKHESILEPLQHHLNVFVNECEAADQKCLIQLDVLQEEIKELNPANMSRHDVKQIELRINHLREEYEKLLNGINRALALTWASLRLDLIEKLNDLKEAILMRLNEIGLPPSDLFLPTGLFNALINQLSDVFKSSIEENDFLKDGDPAIEGLAKFSIWYLPDYWKAGLLPSIQSEEDLEPKKLKITEIEKLEHRQHLTELVQHNLSRIGIRTVGDLKRARIFSKKMLEEYISQHQKALHT